MLWGLFKKFLFFVAITVGIAWTIATFAPKTFEENTVQRCATNRGIGLCAGKVLEKGTSIGWLGRMNNTVKTPVFSETGRLVFTARPDTQAHNIIIKKLPLDDGNVDLYGYTLRDIKQGEELIKPHI